MSESLQFPPHRRSFPINEDDVQEGYSIDADTLEQWIGEPRDSKQYSLGVLGVKKQLERILWGKGIGTFVVQQRGSLVVANQQDAPAIAAAYQRKHLRGFVKNTQVLSLTDDRCLNDEQKWEKYQNMKVSEAVLRASRNERKKLLEEERRRNLERSG